MIVKLYKFQLKFLFNFPPSLANELIFKTNGKTRAIKILHENYFTTKYHHYFHVQMKINCHFNLINYEMNEIK